MPLIPAGSTTSSRQTAINANPDGTSFCLEAGEHTASGSNTPKNGNTFTGQFGATIDGTGWSDGTDDTAVFRSHNAAVINVTIENLIIQNFPQRAVHGYPWDDNTGWIIRNCEIKNGCDGLQVGSGWRILRNKMHNLHRAPGHSGGLLGMAIGAFGNFQTNTLDDVLVEDNELYDFGGSQKLGDATNCVWRRNHIHDVSGPGIWNDSVGTGFLAEDNLIEDCEIGIFYEMSIGGIIRRNTIRRTTDMAMFISTSRDADIYENVIEDCFSAIKYFIDCSNLDANHDPDWGWSPDLSNNTAHDNRIVVPNTVGALANWFTYSGGGCPGAQSTPYIDNSKNNNFSDNEYIVPSLTGSYWLNGGSAMNFTAWQALPRDAGSTISL